MAVELRDLAIVMPKLDVVTVDQFRARFTAASSSAQMTSIVLMQEPSRRTRYA
jgi:hypothetical protein